VIEGKVFDVTDYLAEHPGGPDILLASSKQNFDATEDFENADHSKKAKNKLQSLFIGTFAS